MSVASELVSWPSGHPGAGRLGERRSYHWVSGFFKPTHTDDAQGHREEKRQEKSRGGFLWSPRWAVGNHGQQGFSSAQAPHGDPTRAGRQHPARLCRRKQFPSHCSPVLQEGFLIFHERNVTSDDRIGNPGHKLKRTHLEGIQGECSSAKEVL